MARLPASCISPRVRKEDEVSIRGMMETHPQPSSGDAGCARPLHRGVQRVRCGLYELRRRRASARATCGPLVRCIGLCLDCADVCDATRRIVTRLTVSEVRVVSATVQACVLACPGLARGVRASRRTPRGVPHLWQGVPPPESMRRAARVYRAKPTGARSRGHPLALAAPATRSRRVTPCRPDPSGRAMGMLLAGRRSAESR